MILYSSRKYPCLLHRRTVENPRRRKGYGGWRSQKKLYGAKLESKRGRRSNSSSLFLCIYSVLTQNIQCLTQGAEVDDLRFLFSCCRADIKENSRALFPQVARSAFCINDFLVLEGYLHAPKSDLISAFRRLLYSNWLPTNYFFTEIPGATVLQPPVLPYCNRSRRLTDDYSYWSVCSGFVIFLEHMNLDFNPSQIKRSKTFDSFFSFLLCVFIYFALSTHCCQPQFNSSINLLS